MERVEKDAQSVTVIRGGNDINDSHCSDCLVYANNHIYVLNTVFEFCAGTLPKPPVKQQRAKRNREIIQYYTEFVGNRAAKWEMKGNFCVLSSSFI